MKHLALRGLFYYMELTPRQEKKLKKLAAFLDDRNVAEVEEFLSLAEKIDDVKT